MFQKFPHTHPFLSFMASQGIHWEVQSVKSVSCSNIYFNFGRLWTLAFLDPSPSLSCQRLFSWYNFEIFFFFFWILFFIKKFLNLFLTVQYSEFVAVWAFLRLCKLSLLSSCTGQASHCSDFSCCRAQAPGCVGFHSCSTWAQMLRLLGSRAQACQ